MYFCWGYTDSTALVEPLAMIGWDRELLDTHSVRPFAKQPTRLALSVVDPLPPDVWELGNWDSCVISCLHWLARYYTQLFWHESWSQYNMRNAGPVLRRHQRMVQLSFDGNVHKGLNESLFSQDCCTTAAAGHQCKMSTLLPRPLLHARRLKTLSAQQRMTINHTKSPLKTQDQMIIWSNDTRCLGRSALATLQAWLRSAIESQLPLTASSLLQFLSRDDIHRPERGLVIRNFIGVYCLDSCTMYQYDPIWLYAIYGTLLKKDAESSDWKILKVSTCSRMSPCVSVAGWSSMAEIWWNMDWSLTSCTAGMSLVWLLPRKRSNQTGCGLGNLTSKENMEKYGGFDHEVHGI